MSSGAGRLFFAAGSSTVNVAVPVDGTKHYQPNETFYVRLSKPKNATVAGEYGTATIVSGDKMPTQTSRQADHYQL